MSTHAFTLPAASRLSKSSTGARLNQIVVLDGTAGPGRMSPPASTRISARLQRVQEHSSAVHVACLIALQAEAEAKAKAAAEAAAEAAVAEQQVWPPPRPCAALSASQHIMILVS